MIMALATTILLHLASAEPAYLAPGTDASGNIRHLCLIYHGNERRPQWTQEALRPYVACIDADNKPTGWLFDSFLFIEFETDQRRQLYHYAKDKPQPTVADWQWLADAWFRPASGLNGLEKCVAELGNALDDPEHQVNVVITLPTALGQISDFGALPGSEQSLNFSNIEDQQAAVRWYVQTVKDRYDAAGFRHLKLLGFYWVGESITNDQHALVRWTSQYLHSLGLKHYWIPYFTATSVGQWRDLGFDAMMLQPNYFFKGNGGIRRLCAAAERAQWFGSGVEMEFDGRALTSPEHLDRFWDYLDAGAKYGWMNNALLGWYEGGGALGKLLPANREMYEAICQFVKGTYKPRRPERLAQPEEIPARGDDNLALASKGAKVLDALNTGAPGLEPSRMIDGDAVNYSGSTGLTWFGIPGSVTVQLPKPAKVARVQMLLFDLDERFYTYRIDTSMDGEVWQPAVDKSAGQASGWQVDRFEPRDAQYVRLTGITNSTGQNLMQVIEFEVYPN